MEIKDLTTFKNFSEDIKNNRLFHSIMLINKDSEFLMEYAKLLSGLILGDTNKVEKEIHPDLFVCGKDKPIDTNVAKDIISTVFVAPYEGDKKVYILSNFDDINITAANKLLKTLEEPPSGVTFLLLVSNTSKVLQTILSRAQKFYLEGYGIDGTTQRLEKLSLGEDAKLLSLITDGNLEKAKKIAGNGNQQKLKDFVVSTFLNLKRTTDLAKTIKDAEEFKTAEAEETLSFFSLIAELSIREILGRQTVELGSLKLDIMNIANVWNERALVLIIDAVIDALKMLGAMVSPTAVFDQFFLKILEVRRKCRV